MVPIVMLRRRLIVLLKPVLMLLVTLNRKSLDPKVEKNLKELLLKLSLGITNTKQLTKFQMHFYLKATISEVLMDLISLIH